MNGLLLGGLAAIYAVALIPTIFFAVGIVYVALRVRDGRHTTPDPQLGIKTAFHLLHSLAVIMFLGGLSLSAADLMEGKLTGNQRNQPPAPPGRPAPPAPANDEFWTVAQRSAAALAATGTLFGLIFWGLLSGTNNRRYPAVRRTFVGGRLAVCLLVVFAAVSVTAVVMAQKDPKLEPVETTIGVLIVWLPAAVVHLLLFRWATRRPVEPPAPRPRAIELDD